MNLSIHYVCKSNLGLVKLDKFDYINRLIILSVIPLSGAYCMSIFSKEHNHFTLALTITVMIKHVLTVTLNCHKIIYPKRLQQMKHKKTLRLCVNILCFKVNKSFRSFLLLSFFLSKTLLCL
jgi:hypothetical protein